MIKLISIVGIPGSGKTTQAKLIERALNNKGYKTIVASTRLLMRGNEQLLNLLNDSERKEVIDIVNTIHPLVRQGYLADIRLDQIMIESILRANKNYDVIIFDSFPRGLGQAKYFWNLKNSELYQDLSYKMIQLNFTGDYVEKSFRRQFAREVLMWGLEISLQRKDKMKNKISVYNETTSLGIEFLSKLKIDKMVIDCEKTKEQIADEILFSIEG